MTTRMDILISSLRTRFFSILTLSSDSRNSAKESSSDEGSVGSLSSRPDHFPVSDMARTGGGEGAYRYVSSLIIYLENSGVSGHLIPWDLDRMNSIFYGWR